MKKHKRKIILFIITILILSIFLFRSNKNLTNKFQDELLFFKVFSSGDEEKEINQFYQSYIFQVSYKNIDFKNIYLADSIDKKTLINEKIAPRN